MSSEPSDDAPKISVVLTTYKRADLLPATLDSILNQKESDFELIICDDCSPDQTAAVALEYGRRDRRVQYYRNPTNLGMPGNLNAGLRRARGRYVANLHDGDIYDDTLLRLWAEALDRFPTAAFVFNAYRIVGADGSVHRIQDLKLPPLCRGRDLLERTFFRRWNFYSPVWGTVMARRELYERLGYFDPLYGFISDVDMWMRLAEEYDVAYLDQPLISLPRRRAVPRQIFLGLNEEMSALNHMYRAARDRRFATRPLRRMLELVRHHTYLALTWPYYIAVRLLCGALCSVRQLRLTCSRPAGNK